MTFRILALAAILAVAPVAHSKEQESFELKGQRFGFSVSEWKETNPGAKSYACGATTPWPLTGDRECSLSRPITGDLGNLAGEAVWDVNWFFLNDRFGALNFKLGGRSYDVVLGALRERYGREKISQMHGLFVDSKGEEYRVKKHEWTANGQVLQLLGNMPFADFQWVYVNVFSKEYLEELDARKKQRIKEGAKKL
jgi:hypothetical protein